MLGSILLNTLQDAQAILTFATIAKNSDWSFNMAIYEKNFYYYFELFREMSNAQLANGMIFYINRKIQMTERLFQICYWKCVNTQCQKLSIFNICFLHELI